MRVAQVHWTASPVTGGVEVHSAALHSQLRSLGVDSALFSGSRQAVVGAYSPALEIGARVVATEVRGLAAILGGYDVVHWHNPQWHKPQVTREVVSTLRSQGWRGRVVFDLHNIDDDGEHWDLLAASQADRLLSHSPFVQQEVRSRLPHTPVDLAPLAMTRGHSSYLLSRSARRVLLQPTRLTRWKGSHLSLAAAVRLLEEGHDFVFVHAGRDSSVWPTHIPSDVWERAAPWLERGRISLVHYGPADSWGAIASADVIVHPTVDRDAHGEPFSLSVAQAIICGRPVIASASGHLPTLLAEYEPKSIIPPDDEDALVNAMRTAITGPLASPGRRGRELGSALEASLAGAGAEHLARLYRDEAGRPWGDR